VAPAEPAHPTVPVIPALMLLATFFTTASPSSPPTSPARAVGLRVEQRRSPMGIDAAHPRFSWQMADTTRGARQTAYRLLVARTRDRLAPGEADVWDSGLRRGGATLDIPYGGPALHPRTRYYWTVCLWDQENQAAPCATPSWFETGLMQSPWRGAWIAASRAALDTVAPAEMDTDTTPADERDPLLRKTFTLRAAPVRARVYVTALGAYRLHVNGVAVGPGVLTPDWTDYRDRVEYQTYDVTRLLHRGPNAIGALLGAGWFASRMGFSSKRNVYAPPPVRLLLELHVTYADGTERVIASDSIWRAAPSAVLFSEIYDGETYDARLASPGWDRPEYDAAGWHPVVVLPPTPAAVVSQTMPLIARTDSVRPIRRWSPKRGVYVFDLGQNIAGWARLRVRGPTGTRVRMRFAEILAPDGANITQINLRSAKATDVYILRGGGPETFEPHFTYHGFRYVEVTGYPGVPDLDAITGIVVHSALPETGSFTTSDPRLNRLWENILWTQRANLYGIPTDCPQRDERMGWMGDAQVFWRTASYNMDMAAFGEKWMADVRDGQDADGCFPNFAPNFLGVLTCGAPGWADAGVIIPWTAWHQYGDTRVVAEQWDAMEHYMRFIADSNPNFLWLRRKAVQFGDWLPAGLTTSWGTTNTDLISTAFWAYDAGLMSQMATAIGRDADAVHYATLHDRVTAAFDSAFIAPDGKVGAPFTNADSIHTVYTQTAAVLALRFGLVPDSLRAAVADQLVRLIAANDWHLSTGFLGSGYILPALSATGHDDVAARLLLTTTFPSWLYEVTHGATTVWERWNGDHGNPEMNSYSHYAFGAVGEWLYRYLAGIDAASDAVAFDSIVIHPRFPAALDSVRASYRSVRGPIATAWRRAPDGTIALDVAIPANTTARVELPDRAPFTIGAGRYAYVVKAGTR